MTRVDVRHALGSYPVYVEAGVLGRLQELVGRHVPRHRLALITDETVRRLLDTWAAAAPAFAAELVVPPGEGSKTRARWAELSDALLDRGFGRDSAIVALGGGVIGDLAGFVAATYMRGVPYIQVPTTLLAMVDASVGGKTGVDTAHGKNLIGAFHPPVAVVADPLVLRTLPERELRGGLAEAVKHGLIADREYFRWIAASADRIAARDPDTLAALVRRSVEIKAAVVSEDEREAGRRATLNAGHTVAHALEQASGYALPHGEAVAIGLVTECRLAESLGVARPGLADEVAGLLRRVGLPVVPPDFPPERLLGAMAADKKAREARVRFALPAEVGAMVPGDRWTVAAPEAAIRAVLASAGAVGG
ncbi:MAG TPA: 3-dehydroquinate synthase [Gemmatimonadales bacterium]|nr:3-dehydroquinate synthase [Gemmatimonadales bacterium]